MSFIINQHEYDGGHMLMSNMLENKLHYPCMEESGKYLQN